MSARNSNAETFDVFLCHNSEDKQAIRKIARKLADKNIKPWLDEDEIRPGTSWQTALGQQIESIKSAAVFVGESGLGPWQNQEIQALLSQFVKRECPVIPVILPSAKTTPELPWTLANLHWVDFRVSDVVPLRQLIWGITGEKPREQSHVSTSTNPTPREADVTELLPRKDKVVIEIRLPGNLDEFSDKERDRILSGLYSLLQVGEVHVTRAMAGSIRLHLELRPEDADKIYSATQNGQLAALGISEARLYPAIAAPPDAEQRSQLLILLDRVNETWVDGVLRNSLYNEALISLGRRPMDEAVEPPWKHIVELSSQRSQLLLQDRNITPVFDATGLLLILGDPGSGKTTTLLELAANLLARGKSDAKERVPFVLNLSSWTKRQSLADWIALELSEKYRVPVKIARSWLQSDYLVPLLDGLDELPTAVQPDCVAAINDFIDGSYPSGLVVCCRLMEYQWLPKRLKLNGAICLESLSSQEVSEYLTRGGPKLAALREAVDTDTVLQELAQTPLMLSIMSLACQGADGNQLASQKGDSPEERRKQIFGVYVEQMFQRKGAASLVFPKEKVIGRLSWLARKMREHSQSVFLVEGLQPNWLGARAKRVAYRAIVALSLWSIFALPGGMIGGVIGLLNSGVGLIGLIYGLIFGLIFGLMISVGVGLGCWSESPFKNGVISGAIGGLIPVILGLISYQQPNPWMNYQLTGILARSPSGLLIVGLIAGSLVGAIGGLGVGSLNNVTLVESMSWKWNQFWKKTIPGLIVGLTLGLILALLYGLLVGLNEGLNAVLIGLIQSLLIGLICGLIVGPVFGLVTGLVGGFTDREKVGKASPNQGIKLSRKNSLAAGLVTFLTCGLTGG